MGLDKREKKSVRNNCIIYAINTYPFAHSDGQIWGGGGGSLESGYPGCFPIKDS